MIETDNQLKLAQEAVNNLQQILLRARCVHNTTDYKLMSEPILLELQKRQQEILHYLSLSSQQLSLALR